MGASIMGVRTCPAAVADPPMTTRTNNGRNDVIANIATPIAIAITAAARSTGIANRSNGMRGSAARRSAATNRPKRIALPAKHPRMTGEPQGCSRPPDSRAYTSRTVQPSRVAMPAQSSRWRVRCSSGSIITTATSTIATIPIGRFT